MNDASSSVLVPRQLLESLMGQSIDTLSAFLRDPAVPSRDRADIAFRLLALGLGAVDAEAPAGQAAPDILPVQFVTIPDFLPPEQHAAIVQTALDNQERFSRSTVTTNEAGYRESLVLHASDFPVLYEALKQEIIAALPSVLGGLGLDRFVVAQVEMQITGHGDRAFFKVHQDTSSADTASRVLTYVYYFQTGSRRGFAGGGLRIYQTYPLGDVRHDPGQCREVEPVDNSIVFFDSRLMHEVLPVTVASGKFEDWRFTVNGWLRR